MSFHKHVVCEKTSAVHLFICLADGVAGQLTGRLPGHWASF